MLDVLVLDTAAFIKRVDLKGLAIKLVTCPGVYAEIKDASTRNYIQSLPYDVIISEPTPESLKHVDAITKRSGDFVVLSNTDKSVIALTYELFKEVHKEEPKQLKLKEVADKSDCLSGDEDSKATDDEEEDDWISSDNFQERAANNFGMGEIHDSTMCGLVEGDGVRVGCMTTDFAMQNALLLNGLPVISVEKMRILEPKARILYCVSCYHKTKECDLFFCPKCGQPSLRRIPVTVHQDGSVEYHFNSKYRENLKGIKQPIRRPQGGRHANNPIYCADQRLPERRAPKPKNKLNLFATNGQLCADEEDIIDECVRNGLSIGGDDGNVFTMHDIDSKAFSLGFSRNDNVQPNSRWHGDGFHGLRATRGRAHIPRKKR